jgi:uncharacterized membrane-anchored protein YjiN (DUF445 family)
LVFVSGAGKVRAQSPQVLHAERDRSVRWARREIQGSMMASAASDDVRRTRALAQTRAIATGLLGLMVVLFVLASLGQRQFPALGYLRAFSEAGIAGACADWFAVTALFRRPFGLPIPHTAIIPRNKDRIGAALGGFIADNFLTEAVLQEKLRAVEVAQWGGAWLQKPANARSLAQRIAVVLPEVIESAPPGFLGGLASATLLSVVRATPAGPTAARVLGALWREGPGDELVERGLTLAANYVADHQEVIRQQVAAQTPVWLRWFDRLLAERVTEGLVTALVDMRAPDHPQRRALRVAVGRWIRRLRFDPELRLEAEELKMWLLSDPALKAEIVKLQDMLESRIAQELAADQRGLALRLERALRSAGAWLSKNAAARDRLNAWARELATRVIAPRRQQIGRFVAEVVAGWEAASVSEKLELQVGKDLQFIRINGTLVGGLVGLAIYTLMRAAGLG